MILSNILSQFFYIHYIDTLLISPFIQKKCKLTAFSSIKTHPTSV